MDGPDFLLMVAWVGAVLGPLAAALLWRRLPPVRRRSWPARAGLAAFALAYALAVWAFLIEPRTLVVRNVSVESAEWRGPPLRIGLLSDVHVGAQVSPTRVAHVAARLSRERPDLILLLGDYVGGHAPEADRLASARTEILRGVAALDGARAPLGRVAVLGNHDWWYDGPAIEAALRGEDIAVLENDAVRIDRTGGPFWVAGLADLASRRARPSATLALSRVPMTEPVILLTHWPDPWPTVPGRVALTLAGHTHCGQVNLPIVGRPIAASPGSRRWPCGLYQDGGRKLFVTGGLGVSILPVRFRAPPEIVILTLSGPSHR